jgi:micrococcal nuclease
MRRGQIAAFLPGLLLFFLLPPALPPLHTQTEAVVYVTPSGQRYHRETCRVLRQSRFALSLSDAARSGYTPCQICKPPAPPEGLTPAPGALYRVNAVDTGSGTGGAASFAQADMSRMVPAEVVDAVDGDTIRVRVENPPDGLGALETVRLIGVDTPETKHPSRPVERFGREAAAFTRDRLLGQPVYLAFDWDLRDRYGRLLAYVYLPGEGYFNALLVREGYGHAYTSYAFHFLEEFRALEQDARQHKRGLWGVD